MKRVQITPQVCYCNGRQVTATQFSVVSVADNLFDCVTFKYTLYDDKGAFAGEGKVDLDGCDCYSKWDASPEVAYSIVAKSLGLELIPTVGGKLFEM